MSSAQPASFARRPSGVSIGTRRRSTCLTVSSRRYDSQGRLSWFSNPFSNFVFLDWDREPGHLFVIQRLSADEQREIDIEVAGVTAFPTRMTYGTRVWGYTVENGQLLGVQPPTGQPWRHEYEGTLMHRVTTPLGGTVSYDYDSFTFVTQTTPNVT